MKVLRSILLLIFVSAVMVMPVLAVETQTYTVEELGLTVDLPSDLAVFSQDVDPNDPNLSRFVMDENEFEESMQENNIYLYAMPDDLSYAFFISASSDSSIKFINDLDLLSDAEMESMMDLLEPSSEEKEATILQWEIVQIDGTKLMKTSFRQLYEEGTFYAICYVTIKNGITVSYTFISYEGEVTEAQDAALLQIVESVLYTGTSSIAPTVDNISRSDIGFSDNALGLSFIVPAGWADETDSNVYTASYINGDGNVINITCSDLWNQMDDNDKIGLQRSDLNSDSSSAQDIQEQYETDNFKVTDNQKVTVGSISYFRIEMSNPSVENIMSITHLMVFDGMSYEFEYIGPLDSQAYDDYLSILSSAKYNLIHVGPMTLATLTGQPANASGTRLLVVALFMIGIAFLLVCLPILVYRLIIRKGALTSAKALIVTFSYGVIGIAVSLYLGMDDGSFLPAGAILFWSILNYQILSRGKHRKPKTKVTQQEFVFEEYHETETAAGEISDRLHKLMKDNDPPL